VPSVLLKPKDQRIKEVILSPANETDPCDPPGPGVGAPNNFAESQVLSCDLLWFRVNLRRSNGISRGQVIGSSPVACDPFADSGVTES
jgi:hypothetical protein